MAKESGLGLSVNVDDNAGTPADISNDITDCSWTMASAEIDWTGLDKSARERGLGLADFSITLNGHFNDASAKSHLTLRDYRTLAASQTGRTTTIAHSGQSLPNEVLYTSYDFNRAQEGALTWTAGGGLSDGTVPTWA